jgi:hypothetical protein
MASSKAGRTEPELTRAFCAALAARGALVKAHVASLMNDSGWPDRWICHRLWHGHLEFKGPRTAVTALQAKRIREVEARQPGTAYVARFVGEGFVQLEDADGAVLWGPGSTSEPLVFLRALAALRAWSNGQQFVGDDEK